MEYLGKRIDFEVVTSKKMALERIAKQNFKCVKIFHKDLFGIHMMKPVMVLNHPIQVGFAIPDISKYQFSLKCMDAEIS